MYDKIKSDYDVLERHVVISSKKCSQAEIDLIGYKDGKVTVFEVKCSFRIVKARRQLARIKRLLNIRDVALMFYCGTADQMLEVAG